MRMKIDGKRHIIALGGMPGSGKSTVRGILADMMGYEMFSTGDFARRIAAERGMTIEAYNELVASSRKLDEEIDAELTRIQDEEDNMVVDSHLAYHFIPSAFKVYLETTIDEAARRIFNDRNSKVRQESGDVMETLEEAKERTKKRIENHTDRYERHYGINPYDPSRYDFVVDTIDKKPEVIAREIKNAYEIWLVDESTHE